MDPLGLSKAKFFNFISNRPLSDEELKGKLDKKKSGDSKAKDLLSVIKINECYMELTDRWYDHKGEAVFYSAGILSVMGLLYFLMGLALYHKQDLETLWVVVFAWAIASPLTYFGWAIFRLEAFQLTHYPIRLNRKNRMVYAILPRGRMVRVKWDDLFVYIIENKIPFSGGPYYEIRGNVLADDGETVVETISLGYPAWGMRKDAEAIWEFIRRYMEEPDGYRKNSELVQFCMPIDEKRESLAFCIFRGMAVLASSIGSQIFLSPYWAIICWGRIISVYTSKVPVWPEDIEAECQPSVDDQYSKSFRDNPPFTFMEGTWPLICFAFGSVIAAGVFWWGGSLIWEAFKAAG